MALIPCPDCGREVSEQATACPNCARPLKDVAPVKVQETVLTRNRGCGDVLIFGVVGAVLVLLLLVVLL